MEFVETIRFENGRFYLLDLHQQRLARTIREVFGEGSPVPDLAQVLANATTVSDPGLYKCRVVYSRDINEVEFQAYVPRQVKSIRIVDGGSEIDYHLKSIDRRVLMKLALMKEDSDEVLILRDGLISDTSYTNILFRSIDGALYTPANPLLRGVMRQHLLNTGQITELDLTVDDLRPGNYLGLTEAILINAMMPPAVAPRIPISAIKGF